MLWATSIAIVLLGRWIGSHTAGSQHGQSAVPGPIRSHLSLKTTPALRRLMQKARSQKWWAPWDSNPQPTD